MSSDLLDQARVQPTGMTDRAEIAFPAGAVCKVFEAIDD
jgi:hypothetical protein